jgi:DNA-binding response OmpR family regulator
MTETEAAAANRAPRVLLVEDDEELRLAVTRALVKAGYQVILAGTGAAALAAAAAGAIDAAIVDVFLPDAGGLGVARALRELFGAVPILFVTGLAVHAVREALAPAPVLFKPFSKRQLLASVRRLAGAA